MANSYQKNILRTFKGSKSRFIAIFAIVALGVGFLAGLLSTTPDMEDSMEEYLDGGNLFDLRVVSTLGLTEDDVAALEQVDGVAKVQGGKSADLLVEQDGSELVCRVHALPADPEGEDVINRLTLADGRWPENPNECVVEAGVDTLNRSYDIGDTLTLDPDNENLSDTMNETTFTVVGVVHDTYYFSFEREPASVGSGAVQVILYVPDAAFATDYYTEAYLTVEGAAGLHSFDDEYGALVDTVADRVEAIEEVRCQARYDEVVGEAQAEIDDGWQEYYDGKAEADQELADAAQELADGRQELADGEQEYLDGEQDYADGLAEVQDNEQLVADGEAQMEEGRQALLDAQAEYESGKAELADGERLLNEGRAKLEDAQKQYEDGLAQYESGLAQYQDGKQQYEDGLAQYEAGQAAYDEGLAQYEAGEEQYAQLELLNQADSAIEAGIQAMIDSGAAADENAAREMFSDEGIAETQAMLDELAQLKELHDAEQAAKAAYEEALAQQPEPTPTPEPSAAPEPLAVSTGETALAAGTPGSDVSGTAESTPPAQEETGVSEEELARLKQAYEEARHAWLLGLQAAAAELGFDLDIENETLVALAESLILPRLEQLDENQAQLEQLKQLNAAQKGLDAGIQAIIDSGAAETEEEARALFSDAALQATRARLDAAKAELDANAPVLEASRIQLEETARLLEQTEQQLADAKAQLDAGKAELDAGWAAFNEQGAAYYDGLRQLEDGKRQLDEGWATLTDRQVQLDDAKRQIADAYAQLADARAELDDARATIEENRQKLADGEIEYADAKADAEQELADARAELEDAQADLDAIEMPSWYVWDRDNNVSYNSFAGNVTKVEALAGVFPLFFFLVAALVVSTTMTRMIEEERLQIGTMKALGYANGAIMRKYVLYAMTAAVLGALFGLAFGFTVFPSVIWYAYAMMYYVPAFHPVWRWGYALFAGGSLILCTLAVTIATCRSSLKESPADLMRPPRPQGGQAYFAGAHPPAVAAAQLHLQGHLPQPVPLQAAVLDDRHRGGGLHGAAGHRLRHLGLHQRHHGQAVHRRQPVRPDDRRRRRCGHPVRPGV